jgi:tetratricopeptide (TPR) repeat protein
MQRIRLFRFIPIITGVLFFICTNAPAQNKNNSHQITITQWQSDLDYLQKKIHKVYSNLFYKVTARQFDSAVNKFKKEIPLLNKTEITVGFIRLIAMFRIGHTAMHFETGENENNLKPLFHFYPVTISPFTDGLFIRQIDERYKNALGGRIISIGNDATATALIKMQSVIPAENEQYFKSNLHYYLRMPEILQALGITENATAVTITFLKNGAEQKVTINAEECPEYAWYDGIYLPKGWVDAYENFKNPASALWLQEPGKLRYFEYRKESKTVYVRHTAVVERGEESIKDFFEKVFQFVDSNEVDKMVLDIRLNSGGNNYLNKPVITSMIQSKKINRYGHLFVITGAATFSAAQNLTNELEKYTEAIFVGEPTAENVNFWGDVKMETLPISKLNIKLSWLWWQNMDPRDKRPWTAPQLAAGMSFENYKTGFDSAMYRILNFSEETRIEEIISRLINSGKPVEALATATAYLEDPLHRYCKNELEDKINDIGYANLMNNKPELARTFFNLNVQCFPNSANAHDSYAEISYELGNMEEAIKNYIISVGLDPKGPAGSNSRKMLHVILKRK